MLQQNVKSAKRLIVTERGGQTVEESLQHVWYDCRAGLMVAKLTSIKQGRLLTDKQQLRVGISGIVTSACWKNWWKWFVFTNVQDLGTLWSLKVKRGFANCFHTAYDNSSLYSLFPHSFSLAIRHWWEAMKIILFLGALKLKNRAKFLTVSSVGAKLAIFLNPSSLDA